MMYVNQFRREQRYDVIVLDCAPTAESMRFVSMPTTLEWYMKHIFPVPARPPESRAPASPTASRRWSCPPTTTSPTSRTCSASWTASASCWKIPQITSVRLVTNPERMVLRETQRAFVYFSLHGLTVDGVIVNRVLPRERHRRLFPGVAQLAGAASWRRSRRYFAPVPVKRVPLFTHEVLGRERLEELARALYAGRGRPGGRHPHRGALHVHQAATGTTRCGCSCRSPPRAKWGCSRRATNWWWRSARCGGTSACRPPWPAFRPAAQSWRIRVLTVEMKET